MMEDSNRNQEKKKMAFKISGGGIGAVVLLGGALATAALASAIVVRKNGRSSGKEHRRRRHHSPPPEINKLQKEKDEAQKFVVLEQTPRNGEIKEIESDNDTAFLVATESSTLDEKPRDEEINGETPHNICDIEAIELNDEAICNGFVVIDEKIHMLDEKLHFEPQKVMHEDDVSIELVQEEDGSNEISKESPNLEEVHIEEVTAEREPSEDVENNETSQEERIRITENQPKEEEITEVCYDQEVIKVIRVDNAVENIHIDLMEVQKNVNTGDDNGDIIVVESHSENEQKSVAPVSDGPIIEHENVDGDEKECPLVDKIEEIIQEDEAIEEVDQEDEVKYYVEEQFVKEEEKCYQLDGVIVPEKCDDLIEEKEYIIPCDNKENNAGLAYPTPEIKEELISISTEDIEKVIKEYGADNEVAENLELNETSTQFVICEDEVEISIKKEVEKELISPENLRVPNDDAINEDEVETNENKTSLEFIATVKMDDPISETSEHEEKGSGNHTNETVLSNEVQFIDHEDKKDEKGEDNSNGSQLIRDDSAFVNLEKTFVNKYVEMAKLNEHLTNATSRKIIIATMSVVSSLSCSWFFGLSFVKLCLIVFLTMLLSTMVTE